MTISMTREDLLAKLKQVLKEAQAEDRRVAARHQQEERKALETFRTAVRKALKWDYPTAKKERFEVGLYHSDRPDRCPSRQAAPIEQMIQNIMLDSNQNKTYSFGPGSDIYQAVAWMPESKRIKQSVCD